MKKKKLGWMLLMFVLVFFFSSPVWATRYKVFNGKGEFITIGRLEYTAQFGLNQPKFSHNPGGDTYQLNGPTHSLAMLRQTIYSENQLKLGSWDFRASFRHELDLANSFHAENTRWDRGCGQAWDRYSDDEYIDADQKIRDILREANIAYFSPYFSFRIGKQQLGWGEADGIRLMDQINALDMRKSFVLRDSDEGYHKTRIPLWMVKTDFTPPYLFGSRLGFTGLDLEVTWIPDNKVYNRFAIGPRQGGPWAFPLPDLPVPLKQLNLPRDYPSFGLDDSSFAVRLKGTFLGTFFTINYYYGWSKNFVFEKKGPTISLITDPNFKGNVADGAGLALNLPRRLNREHFFGFTLSRELPNACRVVTKPLGQPNLPVIRVEAMYDQHVKFNYGVHADGLKRLNSDWIWDVHQKDRNVIRYLVGLDWDIWCRLLNPEHTFWLSVQFAQNRLCGKTRVEERSQTHVTPLGTIPGGDPQRLLYAPYDWPVKKHETFTTVLLNTQYLHNDIVPQILWVKDWTYHSYWVKAKIDYTPGDHWRYELGYFLIGGSSRERQFGLFQDSDTLYASVAYHF